jgi:hypothetical protein
VTVGFFAAGCHDSAKGFGVDKIVTNGKQPKLLPFIRQRSSKNPLASAAFGIESDANRAILMIFLSTATKEPVYLVTFSSDLVSNTRS